MKMEPRLELGRQAGKQYAENSVIDGKLLEGIGSPMIPEEQYVKIVNGNYEQKGTDCR